jgi:hypothetical protein
MSVLTSVRRVAVSFLDQHVPGRTKRLILIASLSASMCQKTVLPKETLRKLNHVMELSSNDSALVLPIQLSKAIWNGRDGNVVLPALADIERAPHTLHDAVVKIVTVIPKWLHYASVETICSDILRLMENRELLRSPPGNDGAA